MRIPFFWISLGLGGGTLLGFSPVSFSLQIFSLVCLGLLGVLFWIRGTRFFLPVFLLLLTLLGSVHARCYEMRRAEAKKVWEFLPEEAAAKQDKIFHILEGKVISHPEYRLRGRRRTLSFILSAETLLTKSGKRFQRRSVSGRVQMFLFQPPEVPGPGDQVRCYGFLSRPRRPLNPEEFDYAGYLEDRRIFAIFRGYGRSLRVVKPGSPGLQGVPWAARFWVQRRLERLFSGDTRAVLDALITGHQNNISDSLRDDFVKTGTAHLLAVSGLNITLVAGSFFGLVRLCGLGQRLAAAGSLLVVIFYTALAGFGVPVLRAAWMSTAVLAGLLAGRRSLTLNAFFLAFLGMILADPGNLRGIGCQLSYLSVLGLMIFAGTSEEKQLWGVLAFRGTLAAMLMTLPVGIHYFHVLSFCGILANLLAIPLFHLTLMMGFLSLGLSGVPFLGECVIRWTQDCLQLGFLWIRVLGKIPGGYGYFGSPALWHWIGYYGSLGLIASCRLQGDFIRNKNNTAGSSKRPWLRWLAWGLWSLSTLAMLYPKKGAGFEWTVFSAGQNELLSIQSDSGRHYLVNSGRSAPSDQSRWILHPFLKSRSVHQLEAVLLSDFYRKHTGGLDGLAANFRIRSVGYPGGIFSKMVFIKKPYLWTAMPVGLDLELERNLKIKWLGVIRNQGVLLIETDGIRMVYLPILLPEIFSVLDPVSGDTKCRTILILGSQVQPVSSDVERLLSILHPDLIAAPHIYFETNPPEQKKVTKVDLSQSGALTLRGEIGRTALTEKLGIRPASGSRQILVQTVRDGVLHRWTVERREKEIKV